MARSRVGGKGHKILRLEVGNDRMRDLLHRGKVSVIMSEVRSQKSEEAGSGFMVLEVKGQPYLVPLAGDDGASFGMMQQDSAVEEGGILGREGVADMGPARPPALHPTIPRATLSCSPQSASAWLTLVLLPQRCCWSGGPGRAQRGSHQQLSHLHSSCTHRHQPAAPGAPEWGSAWSRACDLLLCPPTTLLSGGHH
jgi:hypothetical protein